MPYRTFQYRLYPTKEQREALQLQLDVTRNVYNMALEDRKLAWEFEQRHISRSDGYKFTSQYRKTFRKARFVHSTVVQVAINDLDNAFNAFFRRLKAGETPGYPKFQSSKYWNSFGFAQYGNGCNIDGRRLKVFGIGRIRVRWHRPYEGSIKTCRIVRKAGRWFVNLVCDVLEPKSLPKTKRSIGLDMGINVLMMTSDGERIENPRWYRVAQAELRRKQRKVARAKKGSNNRKKRIQEVQRLHQHIQNQRKDFFDKLAHKLTLCYDVIAIEDLTITNMVKNHHLSKSILDAGWGYFKKRLLDKAIDTGKEVILVNPAYTSKTCSNCGKIFENLTLSDRWINCECGLSLDRDHNAAINILKRAGRVRVA